jgi:hypothetical protein
VALPRTFDTVINRHRGRIPLNFLRALAKRESDFNPLERTGSYWGLWQVGYRNVLPGYNERHGTSYRPEDLLKPDVNAQVIRDLLDRIVVAYGKHPSPNLREDWRNPEFVKLVLAGHNAGYSEAAGVGRVASYLEARGIPVTHDSVYAHAGAAGATEHLQNDAKRRWQRAVSDLFYAEGGPGFPWGTVLLTAGAAYAAYRLMR